MSTHPYPWHRGSLFGAGPRMPMCRERRACWKARLHMFRRAGKITPLYEDIGLAMIRRLGKDGRLDPSHQTLAEDVRCAPRSVRRALAAFRSCGLVIWAQRLVRDGWRVAQTSNAYALTMGAPPEMPASRTGGQLGRGTLKKDFFPLRSAPVEVSPRAQREAQAHLAQIAAQRQPAVQARLLGKGRAATTAYAKTDHANRTIPAR